MVNGNLASALKCLNTQNGKMVNEVARDRMVITLYPNGLKFARDVNMVKQPRTLNWQAGKRDCENLQTR